MNIQFQLKKPDILALQEDVIVSSYTHEMKRKYFKWIVSIIILLAGVWLWRTSMIVGVVCILGAIAFWFMAATFYTKMAQASLKKKLLQQDHSTLLKSCTMEFSEAEINRVLDGERKTFPWDTFTRYSEDNDHYFLYVEDLQGLIIPKNPAKVENGTVDTYQKKIKFYVEKIEKEVLDK